MANKETIDRVPLASLTPAEFHRRYRAPGIPMVMTGALDNLSDWSLEFLSGKLGHATYPVSIFGENYRQKPKREWKHLCQVKQFTFEQYAQSLRDRSAHRHFIYLAQIPFGKTPLAEGMCEPIVELQARCGLEPRGDMQLWLGPSGHTSPLHFDSGDVTLMQLHGAKKVVLYPPAQTANLYLYPYGSEMERFSQVDTDRPDFDVFPKYTEALRHKIDVILAHREILFIPLNWWHDVSSLGDDYVCSVNRSWKAKPIYRHFCHARSIAFFLRSKLPAKVKAAGGRILRRLTGAKA